MIVNVMDLKVKALKITHCKGASITGYTVSKNN